MEPLDVETPNGEPPSPAPKQQETGPLELAASHLKTAAEHLENAKAQYESAKVTYHSAKALYEAVEASQSQVHNLNAGTQLCKSCAAVSLKEIFSKAETSKQTQRRRVGDLFHAVENQSTCSFCKFLIEAFQIGDEQHSERLHAGLTSRDSAIYFTQNGNGVPWFRIAGVNTNLDPCPFVWFQTGPPTTTGVPHICVSWEPASQLGEPGRLKDRVYPREREPIQAFNGSLNYDLIRAWMERCREQHGQGCERNAAGQSTDLKIDLIDVKTRRLVRHQAGERYVALSYVWGKGVEDRDLMSAHAFEPRRTDTGTIVVGKYQRQSRLPEGIPQTMEDALAFVDLLGERYLWVDLYCIDQNNVEDKQHQINDMDRIFSSAYVTLICLDGQNADWGLPGVSRPLLQSHQPSIKLAAGRLMATFVFSVWQNNGTSIWDTRAWTLQERLLSPRCILFGKSYVAMACQKEYFHDSMDLVDNARTWLSHEDEDDFRDDGADIKLDKSVWDFKTFDALVSVYSGRRLSDESDALNACRGSFNRLGKSSGCDFLFGLPKQDFLRAMLWQPHPRNTLHRRQGFPSWSWLGWSGRSHYQSWLSEMADYLEHSPSGKHGEHARKKRRVQRSEDSDWHPSSAIILSYPEEDDRPPQLRVSSTVARFKLRLLRKDGALHKYLRTDTQQSKNAVGDHIAILRPDREPIRNVAGEHDNFESTDVSFRLHPTESRVLRDQHLEAEFMFVQQWPRIRDWKKSNKWLFDMVSAVLIIRNPDETVWRLATILLERDRWLEQSPRVEELVLV